MLIVTVGAPAFFSVGLLKLSSFENEAGWLHNMGHYRKAVKKKVKVNTQCE